MDNNPSVPDLPDAKALGRLRVVLVGAQHPGNIGAAARALKVMGLADLVLVAPACRSDAKAVARASGAEDVLHAARVFATLDEAVADCVLVMGTSARPRRTRWPQLAPRAAAGRAVAATAGGPVAVVFGRERSGLDNAELARCHLHLRIPANPDYASLNLAAAVQVVAYELRLACGADIPAEPDPDPVTAADMEGLYRHWQDVLTASGFLDPAEPKLLMRRLRRLFNRAAPDRIEINILRGALRSLDPRGGRNRGSGSAGAGLDRGGFGPK